MFYILNLTLYLIGLTVATAVDDDVVVLDALSFDEEVLGSKDIWLIMFYAPWCGHCKEMAPEFAEAASKLKGQVKLGKVNADEEKPLGKRFEITSFPTLKIFEYGLEKSDAKSYDYRGGRDAKEIIDWGTDLAEKSEIEPNIYEIINKYVFAQNCHQRMVCVINFLPNIYDSSADERNRYLNMIKKVATNNRKSRFLSFFWLQAGDQLDLERALGLGFGFPATIAVSPSRGLFSVMKSSFSEADLGNFVRNLISSGSGLEKLNVELVFKKVDAWDGKDA